VPIQLFFDFELLKQRSPISVQTSVRPWESRIFGSTRRRSYSRLGGLSHTQSRRRRLARAPPRVVAYQV